jgi:F0F1-type ATP synthase alpha subunit
VRAFEFALLMFIEISHPGLLQSIREKKSLTEEITADLKQLLSDFKDSWKERAEASLDSAAAMQPVTAGA